ncbi:hypothetical protein GCM10010349_61160 [Streptomyces flavofungini]|nr:hypothetical protein GCM10010349_61160 [Streptomyces flavofungini]
MPRVFRRLVRLLATAVIASVLTVGVGCCGGCAARVARARSVCPAIRRRAPRGLAPIPREVSHRTPTASRIGRPGERETAGDVGRGHRERPAEGKEKAGK